MTHIGYVEWQGYAESVAFVGNSLLGTVHRTSKHALRKNFWSKFPTFADEGIAQACEALATYTYELPDNIQSGTALDIDDEYKKLFGEDGGPAVPPWESFYRSGGAQMSDGEATQEMRTLLDAAGIELKSVYLGHEDHLGIELLYLSALCSRIATGDDPGSSPTTPDEVCSFLREHPLAWVKQLHAAVAAEVPHGYFDLLLNLTEAILHYLDSRL